MDTKSKYLTCYSYLRELYEDENAETPIAWTKAGQAALQSFENRDVWFDGWVNPSRRKQWERARARLGRWDMTKWETGKLLQWLYVIGERSDRIISQAMYDDDWSYVEADERTYTKIARILKSRGIRPDGKPFSKEGQTDEESG